METSIYTYEVFNIIMAEMKELRITKVDVYINQQVMEDKIFAFKSEKLERERIEDIEFEPQIQGS